MSIIFNDVTYSGDWDKATDYRVEDLKNRTYTLKRELELLQQVTGEHTISTKTTAENQEHIALVLGALSLSQMDLISKEELRRIYTMMISPDKENYVVAQECIRGYLEKFKTGEI